MLGCHLTNNNIISLSFRTGFLKLGPWEPKVCTVWFLPQNYTADSNNQLISRTQFGKRSSRPMQVYDQSSSFEENWFLYGLRLPPGGRVLMCSSAPLGKRVGKDLRIYSIFMHPAFVKLSRVTDNTRQYIWTTFLLLSCCPLHLKQGLPSSPIPHLWPMNKRLFNHYISSNIRHSYFLRDYH